MKTSSQFMKKPKMRMTWNIKIEDYLKKEDQPINNYNIKIEVDDEPKNKDDGRNKDLPKKEDDLKNWDNPKMKMTLKLEINQKMKIARKWRQPQKCWPPYGHIQGTM